MHVDVASHAPHGAKHGEAFADMWTLADGTRVAAVGSVLRGEDRTAVGDLLRTGARAVVTSRAAMPGAIGALDRIVRNHAREHRDDALAAAVTLLAVPDDGGEVDVVAAGRLPTTLVDGAGVARPIYARAAALGTGSEVADVEHVPLHRGDVLIAATAPIPDAWLDAPDRSAAALARLVHAQSAGAAIVTR